MHSAASAADLHPTSSIGACKDRWVQKRGRVLVDLKVSAVEWLEIWESRSQSSLRVAG